MNTFKRLTPFQILNYTLAAVPILMGADKFFNLLANWTVYFPSNLFAFPMWVPQVFMYMAGLGEIVVGVILLWKPKIGALLLMLMYTTIVLDLVLFIHNYWNIAVLDTAFVLVAYAFLKLQK